MTYKGWYAIKSNQPTNQLTFHYLHLFKILEDEKFCVKNRLVDMFFGHTFSKDISK